MDAPDDAFRALVAQHARGLRLHCYRMLGSSHDSDDVLQETLVHAWRARDTLASSDALRPWLYRIATNACLDELRRRKARPLPTDVVPAAADPAAPPMRPDPEVPWLEPCPDAWFVGLGRDPAAAYELKESIALAFVAALQHLSPQQRAVLLLRDVVGMSAAEAATALGLSLSNANSVLHRARLAVRERAGDSPASEVDEALLARYLRAWEALDLTALVDLLHDDIVTSMPPSPTWLQGKVATRVFLAARPLALLAETPPRVVPVGANGQPALAFYVGGELAALHVVRVREGRIAEMHHFHDAASFAAFGLSTTIGDTETMNTVSPKTARAVADLAEGRVLATVEVAAPPERVFRALASEEIVHWWVRPGVFDTRTWTGDVRPGGHWRATGLGRGQPYALEGEFLEVAAPRTLVHTWHRLEAPGAPSKAAYTLEPAGDGTRVTLRHDGIARDACSGTALGWETSFEALATYLAG